MGGDGVEDVWVSQGGVSYKARIQEVRKLAILAPAADLPAGISSRSEAAVVARSSTAIHLDTPNVKDSILITPRLTTPEFAIKY